VEVTFSQYSSGEISSTSVIPLNYKGFQGIGKCPGGKYQKSALESACLFWPTNQLD
jgi:hypothetical protein